MTTLEFSAAATLAAAAIVVVGSGAQVVTGFGFSLVVVPVLVFLVGPEHAVRLANLLAAVVNTSILVREHRAALYGTALRLLVPGALVTPLGAYVVHRTRAPVLSVVVGGVIIVCAIALATGARSTRLRGNGWLVVVGGVSALMNTASGVGGPTVAMYAVNDGWPIEMTRPTMQIFFLGLNVVALASLGPVVVRPGTGLALAIAVAGGLVAGRVVARRMPTAAIERSILVLAIAGGTAAVLRGIAGQ